MFWVVGALLGLALVPPSSSAWANAAHVAASTTLVLAELAAPLLLAVWTVTLARQFRAYRVLGWVSAIGLELTVACSLVWVLNTLLPIGSGFYGTAGILNVLALLGASFWVFWLLLFGFRLLAKAAMPGMSTAQAGNAGHGEGQVSRRRFLRATTNLGVGLVSVAFVGARSGLTIAHSSDGGEEDVPAEPSLLATVYFLLMWLFFK